MAIGAFLPDVMTRVVNVHWASGGFVIGDDSGQIWRYAGKDLEKTETTFGRPNVTNGLEPGVTRCGAFAQVMQDDGTKVPTIVLGGHDWQYDSYDAGGVGHILYPAGMMKASNDGINWDTVFFQDKGNNGEWRNPSRLIWDEDDETFYAEMNWLSANPPIGDRTNAVECWASKDGREWSKIASQPGEGVSTEFEKHCKYHWKAGVIAGSGFAGHQFGLDRAQKDLDKTYPLGELIGEDGEPANEGNPPAGLLITTEDVAKIPGISAYPPINFGEAIWGRGEYTDKGLFETSADSGETWQEAGKVTPWPDDPIRTGSINVVIAAPKKDASPPASRRVR